MFRSLIIILIIILSNNEIFGQVPKLIPYQKNGKWGYISSIDKSVKIKAQYDFVTFFKKGKAVVTCTKFRKGKMFVHKKGRKTGLPKKHKVALIDTNNNYIIPFKYQSITPFEVSNNYIVEKKGLYGIIDEKDNMIFPIKNKTFLSYPYTPHSDTLLFRGENGHGIVTSNGKVIIKDEYNHRILNNDGLCFKYWNEDNDYGYLNKDGTVKLSSKQIKEGKLSSFLYDYPVIDINNQSYLANWEGKVISKSYQEITFFYNNGIAEVKVNKKKYNCIDINTGKELFEKYYDYINLCSNFIIVKSKGKKGLFDLRQKMLIPIIYDDISVWDLDKSNIAVKKGDKWGIVNQENKEIIPFRYKQIYFITKGFIQFETFEGYLGVLDIKNDKVIITAKYNQIKGVSIGESYVLVVELDKKEAVFNLDGKLILPFGNYNLYGEPEQNLFFVLDKIKDIAYYMDIKGNKYIP